MLGCWGIELLNISLMFFNNKLSLPILHLPSNNPHTNTTEEIGKSNCQTSSKNQKSWKSIYTQKNQFQTKKKITELKYHYFWKCIPRETGFKNIISILRAEPLQLIQNIKFSWDLSHWKLCLFRCTNQKPNIQD